jgi:hypothetical protein
MLPTVYDAEHWRKRAKEARDHAAQTTNPEARSQLLEIAAAYEQLARLAEPKEPSGS